MIRELLCEVPARQFVDEYFLRQPFSLPGGALRLGHLGTWEVVETILAQPGADVLVVKEGRRWEGNLDQNLSPGVARRLFDEGYTVLVRHAEQCHAGMAELAAGFARDFTASVDVHLYCTPAGEHGFGWHYDVEDVFILQTAGSKEYSLRKNTVNPWPVLETLPQDMRYETRDHAAFAVLALRGGLALYSARLLAQGRGAGGVDFAGRGIDVSDRPRSARFSPQTASRLHTLAAAVAGGGRRGAVGR